MGLDDGSANRQAHARTLGFGRKERMEDAVHVFRINSGPESSIMINTPSGSPITDFNRSVRARSATVSIASIAFATRLATTCCSWTRSANTGGSCEISSVLTRI